MMGATAEWPGSQLIAWTTLLLSSSASRMGFILAAHDQCLPTSYDLWVQACTSMCCATSWWVLSQCILCVVSGWHYLTLPSALVTRQLYSMLNLPPFKYVPG